MILDPRAFGPQNREKKMLLIFKKEFLFIKTCTCTTEKVGDAYKLKEAESHA